MGETERFSLAGASAAADRGDDQIERWVGDFLASPESDNPVLAAALSGAPHWWFGPVELALTDLQGRAEPEDHVPPEVGADDGWEPPPLLVEWREGRLIVQDGVHRHAALVGAGAARAWALVYFPSLATRDEFAARRLEELRSGGEHI